MQTLDCPHCGYSNTDASRFCEQCGTILARRPPPTPADPAPTPQDPTAAERSGSEEGQGSEEPVLGQRLHGPPAAGGESGQDPESDATPLQDDTKPEPLLGDLPGLLEPADPLEFATAGSRISELGTEGHGPPPEAVDEEERRRLRELFSAELPLDAGVAAVTPRDAGANRQVGRGLQRRFQLEWLLLLVLIVAYLRAEQAPPGGPAPHPLPGLPQAHRQIATLLPNSLVLVNWAYDPATAGEMDRAAQPVIEHLLLRRAKLIVVSQLPAGLASARRLIAKAEDAVRQPGRPQVETSVVIEAGFLPGGAASLPLLGVAPARALPLDPGRVDLKDRFTLAGLEATDTVLHLVVAAHNEDVRHWLEQVQPLNQVSVIAVTSAAADIPLRPYLQSGQLAGLVSGWDGGSAYRLRSERAAGPEERAVAGRLVSGHSWGFGILIVAILLGNLSGIAERRQR
ncbi:MAG: zinc ribbon domain-containing protein [Caldilineaceae bacterium]|nr:zinc ribbon domain-containing protein [Caldilineaceae bacterium]